jgi:prepilin-type N-terminal cleavage/methylation domain-containing protein
VREPDSERGFTIVELMIVVAVIAVLAIVVIPSFMKESARGKAKSEVHPTFAELGTRLDQYKSENPAGTYISAAACPATVNTQGTDVVTTPCADWATLRVQPPQSKLTCSYVVRAGTKDEDPLADSEKPSWVTDLVAPATGWYFIHATCPETEYFTASWDTKIRSKDGK